MYNNLLIAGCRKTKINTVIKSNNDILTPEKQSTAY